MRRKRTTHLADHQVDNQEIGAGLARQICRDCDHIGVVLTATGDHTPRTVIPDWMAAASKRFALIES